MQPKKRKKITDSSGWTHIVNGPVNAVDSKNVGPTNTFSLNLDCMSVEQVAQSQARHKDTWEKSECWRKLASFIRDKIVERKHLQITNCVCLGLGSLSAGQVSSRHEMAALGSILRLLGETYSIKKTIFQDPGFNDVDEQYLTNLGFSVASTPIGFSSIDENTFLFAPHLENEIFATALQDVHPALCIGNGDVLKDRPLHSSATVSKNTLDIFRGFVEATASREMPDYDEDSWCQFTSIYWLRDDTEQYRPDHLGLPS